jgi:hypothetical protein
LVPPSQSAPTPSLPSQLPDSSAYDPGSATLQSHY